MNEQVNDVNSGEPVTVTKKRPQPFWLNWWFLGSVCLCLLLIGVSMPFVRTYLIRSRLETLGVDFHTKPGSVIEAVPDNWVRSVRKKLHERWFWPFYQVTYVNFYNKNCNNSHLAFIPDIPGLERVALIGGAITDDGLKALTLCQQLTTVMIFQQPITDQGVAHLNGLTNLEQLGLDYTSITDEGLIHLQHFTKLQRLQLIGNDITDAGLQHLKSLTNLASLSLDQTKVTDDGLRHLSGLKKLKRLNLSSTQVTETGLNKLKSQLPACKIDTGSVWEQ